MDTIINTIINAWPIIVIISGIIGSCIGFVLKITTFKKSRLEIARLQEEIKAYQDKNRLIITPTEGQRIFFGDDKSLSKILNDPVIDHQRIPRTKAGYQKNEIDYFSNVLLQITLPIVLILALIVGTTVVSLRSKIETQSFEQLEIAKLQIQKQVIVNVVEEMTKATRRNYNLSMLDSLGLTIVFGGEISADTNFIQMCTKVRNDMNTASGKKYLSEKLLNEVLKNTIDELRQMETSTGIIHDYLDTSNRSFARNKVDALVSNVVNDAIKYQNQYLTRLISYYESRRDIISDKRLDELMDKYGSANEEDKSTYAKEIYSRIIEIIKSRLKSQGIKFLDATWNEY